MNSKSEIIKHANWLELFFDLVFVFAIAKATHIISHVHEGHFHWVQIGNFVLVMIPIWWAWTGHTMLTTRFNSNDTIQRFLTLIQMLAIVFFTSFIGQDFSKNYYGFLTSYLVIRILLLMMYVRVSSIEPEATVIGKHLGIGFSIGLSVSFLSILAEPPFRYFLLYLGILIEIITPVICRKILKLISVNSYHMPERFGLLTIILLGETIVSIATKLDDLAWTFYTVLMAINGFIIVCTIWWLYFEIHEDKAVGQNIGTGQQILYGHLGIYCALSIISVVIGFSMTNEIIYYEIIILASIGAITFIISLYFSYGKDILSSCPRKIATACFLLSILMIFIGALSHDKQLTLFEIYYPNLSKLLNFS